MINLILLLINIFINKKIMNAYFFNITNEERNNILDKHKEIYDGYVTEDVYSGSHGFEPEETFEELDEMQLDTIGDGPMDLEHGTVDFNEEVCSICGMIDCECDHHDDSIFDELDDDMVEPLQEQLNRTIDMFNRFKKY